MLTPTWGGLQRAPCCCCSFCAAAAAVGDFVVDFLAYHHKQSESDANSVHTSGRRPAGVGGFCLEQELEAIKEENIKLKLTTKSQQESISVLSHKIHQLETAKSQGEKWFGGNEQFSYVAKRGIQALFGSSEPSQPSPKKNRQPSP